MQQVGSTELVIPQLKDVDAFVVNQAETFDRGSGIETKTASVGTLNIMMDAGDWIKVSWVNLGEGATSIDVRVAAATSSGRDLPAARPFPTSSRDNSWCKSRHTCN